MKRASATTELTALSRSSSLPTFFDNLDSFAETPKGVAKLRELILDLAVRGKLVEQDENDEPASALLERTTVERAEFAKANKLRDANPLPSPINGDIGFSLPSNWVATHLDDLSLQIHYGYTASANAELRDVRMLRITDIQDNAVNWESVPGCEIEPDDVAQYELRDDDLLIARTGGTIGKTFLVRGLSVRSVFASYLIRVIPSGEVSAEYIKRFLESPFYWRQLYAMSAGTGQPNVNATSLKSLVVPLPPLPEQHRIVSKVDGLMSLCDELDARGSERVRLRERASRSCLGRLVSSTRAEAPERKGASPRSRRSVATSHTPAASALPLSEDLASAWQRLSDHFQVLYDTPETLAHLRQSILQLAVQGKLVPQDPNDEPAAELLQRCFAEKNALEESGYIKRQPALSPIEPTEFLFEIPRSWSWVRAAEVSYPVSSGSTPAKTVFQSEPDGGVPYLKVYNIRNQKIDFEYRPQYIDEQHHAIKMKRSVLIPGMVVLNIVGPPLGKTAIIPDSFPQWNCNQAIAFFRMIGDVLPGYVHLFFRAGLFLQNIALIGTAGQDNISVTKCKHIPIPLPPLAEQKRIVAKVDQLLSQCDELSARLRDRQSATQKLLTATIHHLLNGASGDD